MQKILPEDAAETVLFAKLSIISELEMTNLLPLVILSNEKGGFEQMETSRLCMLDES